MAGGQRQLCCAVLRALRELAPANQAALAQVRCQSERAFLPPGCAHRPCSRHVYRMSHAYLTLLPALHCGASLQVSAPLASGRQVQLLDLLGMLLEEGAEADPQVSPPFVLWVGLFKASV